MIDLASAVAGLIVGAAAGAVVGFRRGVDATWFTAVRTVVVLDRVVFKQLRMAEESARVATEQVHELIRNPRRWDNGAGHSAGPSSARSSKEVSDATSTAC